MFATLIRKNFPNVVIINDTKGNHEELEEVTGAPNPEEIITGLRDLHSAGITVCDIKIGKGREGQIKITNPFCFGYLDEEPLNTRYNLPESSYVKYKSDIWCLGCFFLGKNIPKRFMKSQELLDQFLKNESEHIKTMLKVNPEERELPNVETKTKDGCSVQ